MCQRLNTNEEQAKAALFDILQKHAPSVMGKGLPEIGKPLWEALKRRAVDKEYAEAVAGDIMAFFVEGCAALGVPMPADVLNDGQLKVVTEERG